MGSKKSGYYTVKTIVRRQGCINRVFGKLEDGTILAVTREMSQCGKLHYSINGKTVRGTGVTSSFSKYLTNFSELAKLSA